MPNSGEGILSLTSSEADCKRLATVDITATRRLRPTRSLGVRTRRTRRY